MKRTADRLFGDEYHWSVLGAGRNQMPIAAQSRGDGRQRARRPGGLACGSARASSPRRNAEQVTKARQIIEGLGLEIATPDEAREMLKLKGGDKVGVLRADSTVIPAKRSAERESSFRAGACGWIPAVRCAPRE